MAVIWEMRGGGAQRVISILCNAFAARGIQVCLCYASASRDNSTYVLDDGVEIFYTQPSLSFAKKNTYVQRCARLHKKIQRFRPDVVLAFMEAPAQMALTACRGTNVPVVYGVRSNVEARLKSHPDLFNGHEDFFSQISAVVFQTNAQQNQHEALFSFGDNVQMAVIPNPVLPSPYWGTTRNPVPGKMVAIGRIQPVKNYPMLLQAFAKAKKQYPNWELTIYGRIPEYSTLKNDISRLGLQTCVTLAGFVPDVDKQIYDASIFVMSSIHEGLPNALIEAMCLGIPCITTDFEGGGAHALIKDEENGLLVPNQDVDAMAKAMCRLMGDAAFAEQLGSNAALLRHDLDVSHIAGKWIDFLTSISRCQETDK